MNAWHTSEVLLHPADHELIGRAVDFIRSNGIESVLAELLPELTQQERRSLRSHCSLAHVAVLVFPPSLAELRDHLRTLGLTAGEPVPSTVVRDRLTRRHGLPDGALDVAILRAPVTGADGDRPEIEVFALVVPPGSELGEIAARERGGRHESHLALEVDTPDSVVLTGLRSMLTGRGGMTADGGGHNPHDDGTVLYFRNTGGNPPATDGTSDRHWLRRLELHAAGHHPAVLAEHGAHRPQNQSQDWPQVLPKDQPQDPARHLLELMTGAWTTQAIAVAAELELAEHLPAPGCEPVAVPSVEVLAERTGTDPQSLRRLLRYLESLGLLTRAEDSFALTEPGLLLRRDVHHSLRPLALLYGGPFYRSFGELGHSVRTGQEAFRHLFGKGHFDHFADHPELAELFDRAMAAGAPMFEPVAECADFSTAELVVDVGGGNGELLGRILRRVPHLRGVLFERAHVVDAARRRLAEAGCADRCEFVVGDFTRTVPGGGDVYLLSRVLHDWDDEQSLAILRQCARAMPDHAGLLIVERLLPEDGAPSLAVAWDLHMLCNVGGRERTAGHYRRLLAEAGFELLTISDLPLDGNLLRARKRTSDSGLPQQSGSPCRGTDSAP
ncbi:methyltransferase [Kitasatospora sp. NPDC056138]|uniref:methyltransferase n=1 Tax=Kitasatospora sp. NPDC056138 TaxID=3345724 RepID=UPI0035DEC2F8